MSVSVQAAANYLAAYVRAYNDEYNRMTTEGDYPALEISTYLHSKLIACTIAADGWVLVEQSRPPAGSWWIAGGPAICIDYKKSREPIEITIARSRMKATNAGFKPAGVGSGLPHFSGFGYRATIATIAARVAAQFSGTNPYLRWHELLTSLPELQYLLHSDVGAVLQHLRTSYKIDCAQDSHGVPLELART